MKKSNAIFIIILFIALLVRLYGINWDQGQHLHPDERFLTMVATAQRLPSSLAQYLDPQTSFLNPRNIGFSFFVYGTFPITMVKVASVLLQKDNYTDITLVGRFLSALFDVGTVIFVFLIAKLFEKRYKLDIRWKLIAAFFYAIAVLPIQSAHFFTVDSFLVFFETGALFFCLSYFYKHSLQRVLLSGIFFGLALSSKISAVYMAPLFGLLFLWPQIDWKKRKLNLAACVNVLLLFGLIAYFVLRFADPYFFADANFFHPFLNSGLVANLKQLTSFNNPESFYPPGIQWIGKTPFFPLINIVFFGLGLPYFILTALGGLFFIKQKKPEWILIVLWLGIVFIYQSVQYVKSIRYFYSFYPFFALFAAYGLLWLRQYTSVMGRALAVGMVLLSLLWPLAFMNIYSHPHSRVQASEWIYQNIPQGSTLAEEYWDDPLPLVLPDKPQAHYNYIPMSVFDPDSPEKWAKINEILGKTDYIVFSSNRGYGSIMPLPQKYPQMSQFYRDLFAGKLPFRKIKEFTSYPQFSILNSQFSIPDQWSDEAFTVYDHPKVAIFKKK